MNNTRALRVLLLSLVLLPGLSAGPQAADAEWYGWGPRFGLGDDPDQVIGGVHFELRGFTPQVRLRPDVELGLGDDHTILAAAAPVHYVFDVDTSFEPYAGGGPALGIVEHDRDRGDDDTDFEIALEVVGGLEWKLASGNAFFVELNLVFGDLHDAQVVAGWVLRR